MADRIMMTPQELDDGASYLNQRRDAIASEVSALNARVQDIAGRWEGEAQRSFLERYTDLHKILSTELPEVIIAMETKLREAARAIRETDQAIAQAFRG